jgi:hypothetical protein
MLRLENIMNTKLFAKSLLTAATLAAAFAAGHAQAATVSADKYGYEFRTRDVYSEGARTGKFDTFTDGARTGKFDVFSEGGLTAGLDRSGVSAAPSRSVDPYTDGARSGQRDVFTDSANA